MKNISFVIALATFLVTALAMPARAADKEVTVTGLGQCAKCALHEGDKCQTIIQAQEDGKTVTYYVAQNKLGKGFHENVCKEPKKVSATGTVKEVAGKKVLTATKLEVVK
jgi:hypothetical protein